MWNKVFMTVLVFLGIQLGCGIIFTPFAMLYPSLFTTIMAITVIVSNIIMAVYLFASKQINRSLKTFAVAPFSIIVFSIILMIPIEFIVTTFLEAANIPDFQNIQLPAFSKNTFGIIAITLVAPIVEELVFRGAILKYLLTRFSTWNAIVMSSAIFGIVHLNPTQTIAAFIIGMAIGWIYYRTRKLGTCIIMHVFNNSICLILMHLYGENAKITDLLSNTQIYAIYIPGAICILIATIAILKNRTAETTTIQIEK